MRVQSSTSDVFQCKAFNTKMVTLLIAVAVPVMAAPVVVGIPVVVVTVVAFADVVISLTAGVSPVTVGFAVVFSNTTIGDSSDAADVGVFSELRALVATATNGNNQHSVGLTCIKIIFTQSVGMKYKLSSKFGIYSSRFITGD